MSYQPLTFTPFIRHATASLHGFVALQSCFVYVQLKNSNSQSAALVCYRFLPRFWQIVVRRDGESGARKQSAMDSFISTSSRRRAVERPKLNDVGDSPRRAVDHLDACQRHHLEERPAALPPASWIVNITLVVSHAVRQSSLKAAARGRMQPRQYSWRT